MSDLRPSTLYTLTVTDYCSTRRHTRERRHSLLAGRHLYCKSTTGNVATSGLGVHRTGLGSHRLHSAVQSSRRAHNLE